MKHPKLLIAAAFLFTAIHIHAQCILTCPSNITVDATSSAGAVVNYPLPTISGSCGVINLIPGSGNIFPIGTTTVHAFNNPVQTIYGLTGSALVSFNAATPGTVSSPITITGLAGAEQIQAIDFRPATGQLYGLAVSGGGTLGRLYVINTTTGAATAVGASTFSLPGVGSYSIDFNPVVDRIRLVSTAGLNIRLHPDLGTVAATDIPLNPGTPSITDIAYTNIPLSPTTTLYDIDFQTDALYTQNPNAGVLTLVGPLGVDATGTVGFDMSQLGFAYAQINNGLSSSLYTINLATGAATLVGAIGNSATMDIAAAPITQAETQCSFTVTVNPLLPCTITCPSNITVDATSSAGAVVNYPLPTISGSCGVINLIPGSGNIFPIGTTTVHAFNNPVQTIYGLTGSALVSFNAATPGTVSSPITITGLAGAEQIQAIDFRPATGQLYGLAVSGGGTLGRLYVINTTTGAATAVGASTFSLPGVGSYSIDFNPVVDRIRLVSTAGLNIRLHPDLGTVAATDIPLNPGTPSITDIAYTNIPLSPTTTLYDIDFQTDALYTQNPNAGVLTLVGPLGVDATGTVGFDMSQLGFAYAQINNGLSSTLYTINLATGAATLVGAIGNSATMDIAAAPITQAETQCSFTVTVNPLLPCTITCPSNITVDATSSAGAVVNYPLPTTSGSCGVINLIPAPGNIFPIGTTTVHAFNNPVQTIYGLTGSALVSFNAATPGTVSSPITITGLAGAEQIQAIDFRPATGQLYGLAVSGGGTLGRLYVINTTTGAATAVGASTFSLPGVGSYSIDFNPVVDRIRLVSTAGLNIRLHPDLGTIAATDIPLNPGTPSITDIAYTNIPLSPTTTLYDIDFQTDALYTQNPNAGVLTLVGPLGVDATGTVGFDMSQLGFAYAQINNGLSSTLYTINLATGAAILVGAIGNSATMDIAAAPIAQAETQCSFTVTVNPIACVTVFYRDNDGDGYGNAANTTTGCSAPAGYVSDSTDCNDNDNTIHPGAAEICDGKDNDCDGQVDESCTVPPCADCEESCTYTQGFYGNQKGTACYNNTSTVSATQLMLNAFGADAFKVFGNVANKRFFTLYKTDIQNKNIFKMLPAIGSSKPIAQDLISPYDGAYYDDQQTWYLVPIPTSGSQKGKINNMLLAQTITLWFNLRTSTSLGSISLAKDTLVTTAQTACGSGIPTGSPQKFGLPHSVVVYLNGGNGYSNDVNGLFQLANDVLGGLNTSVAASDVQVTIATINTAFDGCRILIGTIAYAPSVPLITSSNASKQFTEVLPTGISIKASPNPATSYFLVDVLSSNSTSKINLQVYDIQGRLMEEKIIVANTTVRLGDRYINGIYIVNARQGNEQAHIKLIKAGQ